VSAIEEKELRVLIAASGTGGHLYPALEVGRAFERLSDKAIVEFVGSGRPLEAKIIDAAGYRRHVIDTVGLKQRGLKGLVEFMFSLPRACWQTWCLLSRFKPDMVLGIGGYVSFLPVTLARLRGITTWIHEAEAHVGMANAVLAHYVGGISTAFADVKLPCPSRALQSGQPVRAEIIAVQEKQPNLDSPKHLLVLGGSQGARALDEAMLKLAGFSHERDLEIWHQCRPENLQRLEEAYRAAGLKAQVTPFIDAVWEALSWADVIVSRAGAGNVREIGVANRPAIFVPFPYAQGQHQHVNAKVLVDAAKALLVEEGDEFCERLRSALSGLLETDTYQAMYKRPYTSIDLDAADNIARACVALFQSNNK
jgi:UDP-N-acetylglucosamine--N-acetylmuramyl-(pentapeptide) pyrophosphoryl-undecaprenol N-acetylglucosamine transferase